MIALLLILAVFSASVNAKSLEINEDYHELLKSIRNDVVDTNGCQCKGYSCSCCVHADVPKIHLNHTVCVVLDYIPQEIGVDVKLNLDDDTLFVEKVSLRNPPPLCAGIPHLEKYGSICINFYNVTVQEKVGACLKLEAKLAGITIEQIDIGCFYYPLSRGESLRLKWERRFMEHLMKSYNRVQEEHLKHEHSAHIAFRKERVPV